LAARATTAAGARSALTGTVVILGAALGLLAFDLRERLMLGDAGANVLGAALGLGATIAVGLRAQVVLLAVLVGLNLASEAVSFSRVIDRVPPLRVLDRCGRLPLDGDGPAGSSRGRRRPR
jgi:UDP-N-acetylmuramyl pentapeptide phosphotransferase/UDP-N-acetylglucosamine-1-phosphate transferase